MPVLAVIGHPVAHSRSPDMQTAALTEMKLAGEWTYGALDVAPEDFEAEVLRTINDGRVAAGLKPLVQNAALATAIRTQLGGVSSDGWSDALSGSGFQGSSPYSGVYYSSRGYAEEAYAASDMIKQAIATPGTRSIGVGVVPHGDGGVAIGIASSGDDGLGPLLALDKLMAAPGPYDTYTLALTVHMREGSTRGHVRLDDHWSSQGYSVGAEPQTILVSVPRKGKHKLVLGAASSDGDGSEYDARVYTIDGDAEPGRVLLPASAYTPPSAAPSKPEAQATS